MTSHEGTAERGDPAARERAPLILVFGDLATRVAALLRARPTLISRLAFAPREAVHSAGAFLHLAPEAAGSDAAVAALIDTSDPRDLLAAALPGAPARLYRALDRAADRVRPRRYYERVGAVCAGPYCDAFLDGGPLDDARLSYFEAVRDMDPLVPALQRVLPESTWLVEGLDGLLASLRARGALDGARFRLPPKATAAALLRRTMRAIDGLRAPDPGFVPPNRLRMVETVGELRRLGARMKNCVGHLRDYGGSAHWVRLIEGSSVYLASDTPPFLAALRRVGPGVFALDQVAGPSNSAVPEEARSAMLRGLAAAGLRIVAAEPGSALARLHDHVRQRRRSAGAADDNQEDDGLGDDDDEEDAEDIAA